MTVTTGVTFRKIYILRSFSEGGLYYFGQPFWKTIYLQWPPPKGAWDTTLGEWIQIMEKKIAILPGDGIGEEVMAQAIRVLKVIQEKFGHKFACYNGYIGGAAWDKYGSHFPEETKKLCSEVDAILFGSVGGAVKDQHLPKWKNCEKESILGIRKFFNFNANFRPVKLHQALSKISPLKEEIINQGVDILFVRELLGDVYFGEHKTFLENGQRKAFDVAQYTEDQIASVARIAFSTASKRKAKVTSVDKANVLDISKLWREVVTEVSADFPNVTLEHMLVDNCAMQLISKPSSFDVILTSNLFGDILSDEGAVLTGSLGLMPSASFNQDGFGFYEPIGGSAPDIAGQNIANPIAQISSLSLMLKYSFNMLRESQMIDSAIEKVLEQGYRTRDIYQDGDKLVGTEEITNQIINHLSPFF